MATHDDNRLGDIINISSSEDEQTMPTKKRPLDDSEDSRVDGISSRNNKRSRQESAPVGMSRHSSSASEEGEIESGRPDADERQTAHARPTTVENETAKALVYSKDSQTFHLPELTKDTSIPWPKRLEEWMTAFCKLNARDLETLTTGTLLEAFRYYLPEADLKPSIRKKAKATVNQMEKGKTVGTILKKLKRTIRDSGDEDITGSTVHSPEQVVSKEVVDLLSAGEDDHEPKDGRNRLNGSRLAERDENQSTDELTRNGNVPIQISQQQTEVVMSANDLARLRRYFPSAADWTNICTRCGVDGHIATNCTYTTCKFCHFEGHWHYACPMRKRCGKCRQIGHDQNGCTEKLALTKEEGLACSFCSSADHLEKDCTDIWRTFKATAERLRKVAAIPPSCSVCGDGEHYSADCGQRGAQSANPTWSLNNCHRYVDPDPGCGNLSIEQQDVLDSGSAPTSGAGLKIRGHATRTTHVYYSESDDSDVEFLGKQPISKRNNIGTIRMATNIQLPVNGGAQGGNSGGRPPPRGPSLPAKPSKPASGLHGLPAKPSGAGFAPAPTGPSRGGHRGGRGPRGGRGGRSGRARGRGRGF